MFLGLRHLQLNISEQLSYFLATFITGSIFLLDTLIQTARHQNKENYITNGLLTMRVLASTFMSWIGGMGITLRLFLDTYKLYRPSAQSKKHLYNFLNMTENEPYVLKVWVLMVILLFLLDNISQLFAVIFRQKEEVEAQKATITEQSHVIIEKDAAISESYQHQLNLIASIQHELGGKLPVVKNTLSDLEAALINLQDILPGFSLSQKIRDKLPGEESARIDNFDSLIGRMQAALHYSIATVNNIRGIIHADPSRFRPTQVHLLSWLKSEVPKHLDFAEPISLQLEGIDCPILADPRQLSILIYNVVENAKRHAFLPGTGPHSIYAEVTVQDKQGSLHMHNNGMSLPDDFNVFGYFSPGKHYGPTGHSGLGGYLIGMIAKTHDAKVEIKPSALPGFVTVVSFTFPHNP
jgi:signal transduction histidine kinase